MCPDATPLVVITITTRNQLYRARLLMSQLARYTPEAKRIVYLADGAAPNHITDPTSEYDIVAVDHLALPRKRQLAYALDPTGWCCALKPWIMQDALSRTKAKAVLYADNDIGFYQRPSGMLERLRDHPVVLTPHLLKPLPPEASPNEAKLLPYGAYNAGLLAADNSSTASQFLEWWGSRLLDPRHSVRDQGYDQPWLAWAPLYFPNIGILRDPGTNVAFWNLAERPLSNTNDCWCSGSALLVAFHFSSLEEHNPIALTRSNIQASAQHDPLALALVRERIEALEACGRKEDIAIPYGYASHDDGHPIEPCQRIRLSEAWSKIDPEVDPFCRKDWIERPSLRALFPTETPRRSPVKRMRSAIRRLLKLNRQ